MSPHGDRHPGGGDVVELRGLRVRGRHGVLAAERELGQVFVVDLGLHLDAARAARSDDLADAVDYARVAEQVHALVAGEPVALLETLAHRIADLVLDDVRVRGVEVAVHKPQAPVAVPFDDVVVRIARRNARSRAVLALGSSTGDPSRALVSAVAALDAAEGVRVTASSPVYRTTAVLPSGEQAAAGEQPDYLNAVVAVTTSLTPGGLLAACQAIEVRHGRDRAVEGRWGPRPLDIDLLTLDGAQEAVGEGPTLPHPRAHERGFVLVPWAAMAPRDVLPGHGDVAGLAERVGSRGVTEVPGLVLWPRTPARSPARAGAGDPP